ncbi:MAG: T9SS type A sorting domain-containing protein [Bacteroidetes bacterium]|nr:T9SS type A sorting domain-containing protein [Bacteroidota bacterium]
MPFRSFCLVTLLIAPLAFAPPVQAQAPYFTLEIEEVAATNAPSIHSTAVAEYNGLWVFVTGRVDGLHLLFGGEAFPADMSNNEIIVYDPDADHVWSASLDELSDALADPLRTTNAQHHQDGNTLYILGGYGYSNANTEKITFGELTAIDLPGIISAVQNATPLSPHIRQMASDDRLKVTGGHLILFDGTYYLVGGNRFDGEYLAGFTQVYTEAVRSFEIDDDGSTLAISNFTETSDADNLHRRDGNLTPVILDDGSEGFALFGGVFRTDINLPYRSPVYFDGSSMTVDTEFEAQFGHYTSPVIPLYDADPGAELMHSIFLGGMNQFYYDETDQQIKEDNLVPFVDDVTMITRNDSGTTTEMVLPITLPGLLGTNATFFLEPSLPQYDNGVIKLRELDGRTLLGRVLGGIESDAPNAGWLGGNTSASDRMFEVYVTAHPVANEDETPTTFQVLPAAPNPFREETHLNLRLDETQQLSVEVFDLLGRRVSTLHDGLVSAGSHSFVFRPQGLAGGVYIVRVVGKNGTSTQRIAYVR